MTGARKRRSRANILDCARVRDFMERDRIDDVQKSGEMRPQGPGEKRERVTII
jgi:hypothetical protein